MFAHWFFFGKGSGKRRKDWRIGGLETNLLRYFLRKLWAWWLTSTFHCWRKDRDCLDCETRNKKNGASSFCVYVCGDDRDANVTSKWNHYFFFPLQKSSWSKNNWEDSVRGFIVANTRLVSKKKEWTHSMRKMGGNHFFFERESLIWDSFRKQTVKNMWFIQKRQKTSHRLWQVEVCAKMAKKKGNTSDKGHRGESCTSLFQKRYYLAQIGSGPWEKMTGSTLFSR